jgi:hypothetical protein
VAFGTLEWRIMDKFKSCLTLINGSGLGDSVCRILALYSIMSHLISESQV